jgi:hypothetical protein
MELGLPPVSYNFWLRLDIILLDRIPPYVGWHDMCSQDGMGDNECQAHRN